MSPVEVIWRVRNILLQRAWRRCQRLGFPGAKLTKGALWAGRRLTQDAKPSAKVLRHLLLSAERLLQGTWGIFDREVDVSALPDWFRDPVTGRRWPPEAYCFDIPYRQQGRVGNVKYIWELSRLQHITVLASAYRFTGEVRFANFAATHLRSWIDANPPLCGIHWVSGIEIGMRLLAWVWTRRLLDGWEGVEDLFERNAVFQRSLHAHQHWLHTFYSRGSSANNHLIAEAAGQYAAAVSFPLFRQSTSWARGAAKILVEEVQAQTFADGMIRELASDYHPFVLELLILAAAEGDSTEQPLPDALWRTIRSIADAFAAMLDERLRLPRQGDGDDGRALLVDAPDLNRNDCLLELCERLFGRCNWWPMATQGSALAAVVAPLAKVRMLSEDRPDRRPEQFPEAGQTYLRDLDQRVDAVWCRIDHGPHGYLATTAHAHADALSFEMRVGGNEVFADSGTYCYHGEPEWRRYFRSTIAHNTLEIGGQDQAIQGGPFLWNSGANGRLVDCAGLTSDDVAELEVSHDGYQKRFSVEHHRRFTFDRRTRTIEIEDWLEGDDKRLDVRLSFNLAPAVNCVFQGCERQLSWGSGKAIVLLPSELSWSSHRGETSPPMGWYSDCFGHKSASTLLLGCGSLRRGEHIVTVIRLGEAARESAASAA
jgi:hypothetical protein